MQVYRSSRTQQRIRVETKRRAKRGSTERTNTLRSGTAQHSQSQLSSAAAPPPPPPFRPFASAIFSHRWAASLTNPPTEAGGYPACRASPETRDRGRALASRLSSRPPAAAGDIPSGSVRACVTRDVTRGGSVSLRDTIIRSRLGRRARAARLGHGKRRRGRGERRGRPAGWRREAEMTATRGAGVGCSLVLVLGGPAKKARPRARPRTQHNHAPTTRPARARRAGHAPRGAITPDGGARGRGSCACAVPANRRLGWLARGAPRPASAPLTHSLSPRVAYTSRPLGGSFVLFPAAAARRSGSAFFH
jgi:hypothetical protein